MEGGQRPEFEFCLCYLLAVPPGVGHLATGAALSSSLCVLSFMGLFGINEIVGVKP